MRRTVGEMMVLVGDENHRKDEKKRAGVVGAWWMKWNHRTGVFLSLAVAT